MPGVGDVVLHQYVSNKYRYFQHARVVGVKKGNITMVSITTNWPDCNPLGGSKFSIPGHKFVKDNWSILEKAPKE